MISLGNEKILQNERIAFLCSRSVPSSVVFKSFDWAKQMRDQGRCVVCGNHSPIEKDVFDILLRGSQPLILVLARELYKRWDEKTEKAINNGRLLVITPFEKPLARVTRQTALIRNELMMSLATRIVIGYASPNGQLNTLLDRQCKIDTIYISNI